MDLTIIRRSLNVLTRPEKKRLIAISVIQIGMNILDLFALALVGVLGALSVTGVSSRTPESRVSQVLVAFRLENFSFQMQVAVLGVIAASLLLGRSLLSIYFARKTLFFLSRRGAALSTHLISRLLAQPILRVQLRTTQQTLFAVTAGVSTITLGVLGMTVSILSDMALLIFLSIGLFVVDPVMAITTLLIFGGIGFSLYKLMHKRAAELGARQAELNIESDTKIIEVLTSYREVVVKNRRGYYANEIGKTRYELADTLAELSFMPSVGKYVIEASIVFAAIGISASQFILNDGTQAISTLAVFLAAGSRIAPAVLRVQQSAIAIRSGLGVASPTLDLIEDFGNVSEVHESDRHIEIEHKGFHPSIKLKNVSMTYPGKQIPAVKNVSIEISPGDFVALVGPSGAGKTTIVDVILGVLSPDEGSVEISSTSPLEAIKKWSGAISYVPQDVVITNASIGENVSLGFPNEIVNQDLVLEAIDSAQLSHLVFSLERGIDSPAGERGSKLSGGQRQRLGIARAMFTKPKLLVLDEATSALDGQTESDISDALLKLKGKVTLVMIAHRLSTVRNADLVIYMDGGSVIAQGTFEEVRSSVADFDKQAKLMGL
jgi:ABC-type multidrug transport system fused ATPase/permease subunit